MTDLSFRNLFIYGDIGVGKTYLAKQILEQAILEFNNSLAEFEEKRGAKVFQLHNCSELMFLSRKPTTGEELLKECVRVKGLVLDDLGMGKRSDYLPDIVYIIIEKRMQLGRPTIVTSNVSLPTIAKLIDDRLASRLASFEQLVLKGKDRRVHERV